MNIDLQEVALGCLEKTLRDLLKEINDPRRDIILAICDDHKDIFHKAKGSGFNHQAWVGGYGDHIAECLRINNVVYDALNEQIRVLDFSKPSAAIVLFLHDIEKPFRYGPDADERCHKWKDIFNECSGSWEDIKWSIIESLKEEYGLELNAEEVNALKYTHGEGNDHRKDKRVSSPLAAHVHHCDNISARIWHNKGKGLSVSDMSLKL